MLSLVLACAQIALFCALIFVLCRSLIPGIKHRKRRASPIIILLCFMAVVPWLLMWISLRVGWFLYTSTPTLQAASWDVGLAFWSHVGHGCELYHWCHRRDPDLGADGVEDANQFETSLASLRDRCPDAPCPSPVMPVVSSRDFNPHRRH